MNTEFNSQRPRKQKATSWAYRVGALGATGMIVVTTAAASTAMPPPPDPVDPALSVAALAFTVCSPQSTTPACDATVGSQEARLIETPCFIQPLHRNTKIAVVGPIATCQREFTASAQHEKRRLPLPAHGSGAAVYIKDGRVVAIRRDPLPPGAYPGQGVDYSPNMTAYILDDSCAN